MLQRKARRSGAHTLCGVRQAGRLPPILSFRGFGAAKFRPDYTPFPRRPQARLGAQNYYIFVKAATRDSLLPKRRRTRNAAKRLKNAEFQKGSAPQRPAPYVAFV